MKLLTNCFLFLCAGIEEQINFSQQSLKMLKMGSESFIQALLLFLGLFFKIFLWCPCIFKSKETSPRTSKVNCLISRDFQLLCKGYLLGT